MSALQFFEDRARWVIVCVAFGALANYMFAQLSWTIDDAYITYRYAENVVAGHGPVYNPGEAVEGYTCFSWMSLLALAGMAGVPVPVFAKFAGMISVFGSVSLLAFWDRVESSVSRSDALVAAVLLATCASFAQWGPSGMETGLFCLLAVAVVFVYLRLWSRPTAPTAVALGTLGCLLTMTRPNGIVLLAVILIHALRQRRDLPTKTLGIMVGAFVILYGSYFLWRMDFYGFFLPNTFYAKVGSSNAQLNRGVRYVIAAMPAFGLLVAPIVSSWGVRRESTPARNATPLLLALTLTHIVYVILVGGDNFPAHRFLVVIVPFLCLLSVRGVSLIAANPSRKALLLATLVGYNFVARAFDPETRVRIRRDYVAAHGTLVGRYLADFTPDGSLIATNSAGALAYYSGRPTVDMLGLNAAEIAHTPAATMGSGKAGHEKGNGFYVLSREPDYILFGPPKGSVEPMFKGGKELAELGTFKRRYVLEQVKISKDFTISMYRRLSDEEIEKRAEEAEKRKKEFEEKKKREALKKKRKKKKKKAKKRPPKPTSEKAEASPKTPPAAP